MRLTKQTNYALRMLMYCADNQGSLSRIPDIAKAYAISEFFYLKSFNHLLKQVLYKQYEDAMVALNWLNLQQRFRWLML